MTYPRAHLIDSKNSGFYHLTSRCVRRAWLCGIDDHSGQNFDHRRVWIERRILQLGQIFATEVFAYAVMSNHYHLVVRVDPLGPLNWSDEVIARKWLALCPPGPSTSNAKAKYDMRLKALLGDDERLAVYRERLGSLSWFMRFVNEPLARMANREDQCTGRFWEGRFKSQALLDDSALLACVAYVDLNPVRAGITQKLEDCPHTSIRYRIQHPQKLDSAGLGPLNRQPGLSPLVLEIGFGDYKSLLEWTIREERGDRDVLPPSQVYRNLGKLGQSIDDWWCSYDMQRNRDCRAFGSRDALRSYIKRIGQKWIKYPHQKSWLRLSVLSGEPT